jgi:hypothetical protein
MADRSSCRSADAADASRRASYTDSCFQAHLQTQGIPVPCHTMTPRQLGADCCTYPTPVYLPGHRHDLPVDDEAHLLFSCPATAVVRRERRFAQLPITSSEDLMCCRDVYGVALFVHKGLKIADAGAVAAARQQPR